jgi:hypothetical protein
MGRLNKVEETKISESTRKVIINKALEIIMWTGRVKEVGENSPGGDKYRTGAWFEGEKILIIYESRPPTSVDGNDGYMSVMIYFNGNLVFHESDAKLKTFSANIGWEHALWLLHKEIFKHQEIKH